MREDTSRRRETSREQAYWAAVEPGDGRRRRLWRAHSDAVNLRLLEGWFPGRWEGRLLKTDLFDEAAGEGLQPALQMHGASFFGVDISESILAAAKRGHPGLIGVVADVRRLPFRAGAFDGIISISTLDHFDSQGDIAASLEEIYTVLRPGGRLLLTLDNLTNPKILLRNSLPWSLLRRTGLVPYYVGASLRPRQLRRTLAALGFQIVSMQATLHCPRILAVAASSLPIFANEVAGRSYLRILASFEILSKLPTRFLTGHFVAVLSRKSTDSDGRANPGKALARETRPDNLPSVRSGLPDPGSA